MIVLEMPVKGPGKGGRVGVNEQQSVIASFSRDTTRGKSRDEKMRLVVLIIALICR